MINKNNEYNNIIKKIEDLVPKEIKKDIRSVIVVVMLSKYIKTVKAIVLLDSRGFFEDAKSLVRTLFDIIIIIAYSEKDIDERYKRYEKFSYVIRQKFVKNILKLNPDFSKTFSKEPESLEFTQKMYDEYIETYGRDTRNWNGISFADTVKKVAEEYDDEEFIYLYEIVYRSGCDYIHTNSNILANNYSHFGDKEFYYKADPIPDDCEISVLQDVKFITDKFVEIFPRDI